MLSTEYVLLGSLVVFGVSAGAVEVRGRVNAGFQQMGDNIEACVPVVDAKTLRTMSICPTAAPKSSATDIPALTRLEPTP